MLSNISIPIKELTCPICKDPYKAIKPMQQPKILPCGRSLCNYCITVTVLENPNDFECVLCKRNHQVPNDGFPLNEELIGKLNKNLANLSQHAKEFKEILNQIEINLKQAEFDSSHGDYVIKEYCRELRRQVQLAKEIKVEQLNEISDRMIKKIDLFEKQSLEVFLKENGNKFSAKFAEIKDQLKKWNEMLDENIETFNKETNQARELQSVLAVERENLLGHLFDGKMVEFLRKTEMDENSFGKLTMSTFDTIDFKILYKIDLSPYFDKCEPCEDHPDCLHSKVFSCFTLENNNLLILVYNHIGYKHYNLNAFLFDENKSFLMNKIISIDANFCRNSDSRHNKICFDYVHKRSSYLCLLNSDDLEIIKELEIEKRKLVGTSDSFIFLTSDNDEPILLFNWSFEFYKSIGQRISNNEPFFFPSHIFIFVDDKEKYYSIDNKCLRIIDSLTGQLCNSINVKEGVDLFAIDSDNRILLVNGNNLHYMDLKGKSLKEIKLINHPGFYDTHWSIDKHNNFLIFDSKRHQLYIKQNRK